ncbi:MAG: Hsp70 family protein [bacterium]
MAERADSAQETPRFIVGIDLGTTNSAVAYVERSGGATSSSAPPSIRIFELPQLVAPGEVAHRNVLPSFLYLAGSYELAPGSTALPWDPGRGFAVGEMAREQGALVPGRVVSSAKSWLCHGGVDRKARILPWGADSDVEKVSPVEASARYLQHVREAWNDVVARGSNEDRFEEQTILLTVPASFDEVARELTVAAAGEAGFRRVTLVEEPLAAFYAWLSRHEQEWRARMHAGQLVLVCDVGGGTTDFTVVAVRAGEQGLRFERLAVGDHLMLGGDNMDLTLGRYIEAQFAQRAGGLDTKRWHQLCHQCRKAKEDLLSGASGAGRVDITVVGSGGKLIAGTLKSALTREKAEELILDGFFPFTAVGEEPRGGQRTGLSEFGLPYAQDPAVTRHLSAFWQRHRALLERETGRPSPLPDFVLFNGGALTPASIRSRMRAVIGRWFEGEAGPEWMPEELENPRPDLAVAVGAAYYGRVRTGVGVRVGAGSPRSYYVEVAPAPGGEQGTGDERLALCVVPRGTEEGFETVLERPAFQVLTNQPVSFQLLSSSTRLGDRLGEVVSLPCGERSALPPIRTLLRYGKKGTAQPLPIELAVRLTEVGTLELWCHSHKTSHRWQLQFDVRQDAPAEERRARASPSESVDQGVVERAQESIRAVFAAGRPAASPAAAPEGLLKELTGLLEQGKERWPTSVVRKLADTLIECRDGRLVSAQHQARWLNLLGFCLRPGFGYALDDWRIREVWKVFPQGTAFPKEVQGRTEWWIFWRRVAGGLSAGQQGHFYQQAAPLALSREKRKGKGSSARLNAHEEMELWMALGNFERLEVRAKTELGRCLISNLEKGRVRTKELWTIGRLGARIPLYGPLDRVIPGKEASSWLNRILECALKPSDVLMRTLVQLARRTGDRERDLPEKDRERLSAWLEPLPQGARLRTVLQEPERSLGEREQEWMFGESLPSGLVLEG